MTKVKSRTIDSHYIRDCDIAGLMIPYQFATNIEWDQGENGEEGRLMSVPFTEPRRVSIFTRSWAGVSLGAIHWYVSLEFSGPRQVFKETGEHYGRGGVCDVWKPQCLDSFKIDITCPITAKDIEMYPDNYTGAEVGDPTTGFHTEEEAVAAAKKYFLEAFEKGFVLEARELFVEDDGNLSVEATRELEEPYILPNLTREVDEDFRYDRWPWFDPSMIPTFKPRIMT